jgi:hypothetical protein
VAARPCPSRAQALDEYSMAWAAASQGRFDRPLADRATCCPPTTMPTTSTPRCTPVTCAIRAGAAREAGRRQGAVCSAATGKRLRPEPRA